MAHPVPDWRNAGVLLRVLLGANLLAAVAALLQADSPARWQDIFVTMAAWLEAPLLVGILVLALGRDLLWRLPSPRGQGVVISLAAVLGFLQYRLWQWLDLTDGGLWGLWRATILAILLAGVLLLYLDLRARAYSPAVAEARLMALNARIRPHFLFNSINAVLSLIRAEPRRAESALETVSDLFRAALRDPADWLPLSDEIALCRQYIELEKLRLGERLQVDWDIRDVPLDASLPPLMLQPLVENAVYHGVEPTSEGGCIRIAFEQRGEALCIEVSNPIPDTPRPSVGNQMALANIRERLALYFDLEARLDVEEKDNLYRVRLSLPCKMKTPLSPY